MTTKYKYIKYFPKPFLNDLISNRCLPLIGAGFSKNADIPTGKRMPDWNELGYTLATAIQDYKYTNTLDAISAYCHEYSRANLIESLSELLLINSAKAGKAHKAFCELQFDIVCTTNFEFLLEQGYSLTNKYCRPIIEEEQLSVSNSFEAVILLKLHGDLHHPKRLIVTEEDYDAFLAKNPMLATYLANLLITRTPLFIGYSLDDNDFRQIWQLIKDRLGALRRQAYVLKVDCSPHEKARYERRGVKVINIEGNANQYPKILEEVFTELKDYWNAEVLKEPTISEEATLAELALPEDTNNRLCFFSVPVRHLSFYKKYIFPIVRKHGLVPISGDDVISVGDNWMAKIYALINKSEFIVFDIATKNTMLELSFAIGQNKSHEKILIIQSENASMPTDVQGYSYLIRPEDPFESIELIGEQIDTWFARALERMKATYDEEPRRLLGKKEYKAAVISAMTLLEIHIRQALERRGNVFQRNKTLPTLYSLARENGLINEQQYNTIKEWSYIRNKLVHTRDNITSTLAKRVVNSVYELISAMG